MSVAVFVEKSPMNPVAFVPRDFVRNKKYNQGQAGTDWQYNLLLRGETKVRYYYPAQFSDRLDFQFWLNTLSGLTLDLELIDTKEKVLKTWSSPQILTTVSNVYNIGVYSIPLFNVHFKTSLLEVSGLKENSIYCFRLKVGYNASGAGAADTYHYEISEPIKTKACHHGTILIVSKHDENDYNTVFLQTGALFAQRVEGALHAYVPDSIDTTFKNDSGNVRPLFGQPGATYTLTIGGKKGIPEWVKSRANYGMICKTKIIDNRQFVKDESAKWETISGDANYPLGGISISVRESDPEERFRSIIIQSVKIYTHREWPEFIHTAAMSDGTNVIDIAGPTGTEILDSAAQAAFLSYLNGRFSLVNSLSGTFSFSGNDLIYMNGAGEFFLSADTPVVLPKAFKFHTTATGTFPCRIHGTNAGIVYDTLATDKTNMTTTFSYAFPADSSARTITLYHDDNLTSIEASHYAGMNSVSGTLPVPLISFSIESSGLGEFDFSILNVCQATLVNLNLDNNAIDTLTNIGAFYPSGDFFVLTNVDLSHNALTVANCNDMLNAIDGNANNQGTLNGQLHLDGQGPTATPDKSTGSPYDDLKNTLHWTVTTD